MSRPVGEEIEGSGGGDSASATGSEGDPDAAVRIQRLEREIERLKLHSNPAQRTQFRRMAAALAIVGVGTVAAGWYLEGSRAVLFALGGTALFASFLLFFLKPERLVPATTGEYVYSALATNSVALIRELGLQEQPVYVPRSEGTVPPVSLFLPLHPDHRIPDESAFDSLFIVTDEVATRGVSLRPSASDLLGEFVFGGSREIDSEPARMVDQLTEGLRDTFGIVESITTSVDADEGRASVGVAGSAFGPVDRFDNPVTSFLAAGLAMGLGSAVTVEVQDAEGSVYDHVVTCRWSPDET